MVHEKLQSSGFVSNVIRHGAGRGAMRAGEGVSGVIVDIDGRFVFAVRIKTLSCFDVNETAHHWRMFAADHMRMFLSHNMKLFDDVMSLTAVNSHLTSNFSYRQALT